MSVVGDRGSVKSAVSARHSSGQRSRASLNVTLPNTNTENQELTPAAFNVQQLSPREVSPLAPPLAHGRPSTSGTVPPQVTPTKTVNKEEVQRYLAVQIIERTWLSYRDQQMFKLLKHAICAAEQSLSHEILKKVNPKEAQFLKDKCQTTKVRFRFGGREFPPLIFFKVYTCTGNGMGIKYISGKRMIQPASEAAKDACDIMGQRKFLDQVIQDVIQQESKKITDETDVATLKDYMQYLSNLDETPAYMGGRDNSWRKLTLEDLPRTTVFYDVVEYLYSKKLTERLQEELPRLLIRPVNQDMLVKHIQIISELRTPTPPMNIATPNLQSRGNSTTNISSRRTKQARQRVARMRKMYERKEGDAADDPDILHLKDNDIIGPEGDLDDWEEEANELYEWTQELSLDEIIATPRLNTAAQC